jgi:hypothetical protein
MMKVKPILVRKHRAHRVLFENNSPFRRRTVENKKREFKRAPKHRKQEAV